MYAPKGVVPGMKVKLLGPDGFNYWFNQTVVVKSIQLGYSESDTKIITTIPQSGSLYFDAVNRDAGLVFQFTSDRILNFPRRCKRNRVKR